MVEVLNVEQGGRKNMRVIEKNSGKIRRANLSENRNNDFRSHLEQTPLPHDAATVYDGPYPKYWKYYQMAKLGGQ